MIVSQSDYSDVTVAANSSLTRKVSASQTIMIKESVASSTFRTWNDVWDPFVCGVNCAITSMPSMSAFTTDKAGTIAGDYFFKDFNYGSDSSLTSLPAGSFDASKITTIGDAFFRGFNGWGSLASLPTSFKLPRNIISMPSNYSHYYFHMFTDSNIRAGNKKVALYFAEYGSNVFSGTGISPTHPEAGTTVYVNGFDIPPATYYTVTFDPHDYKSSPTSKIYESSSSFGVLPLPTRAGYAFKGWWSSPYGSGTQATPLLKASTDATYYAHWEEIPITYYTITFNTQCEYLSSTHKTYEDGSSLCELPTPVRPDYTFNGWWTTPSSGGTQVTSSTIVKANTTYYARWAALPIYYTITFNPQGGSVSPTSFKFEANTTFGTLPIPKKAGYVFESWNSKSDGSGTPYYSATSVNANIVAYAIWRLPSKEKDIISFSLKGTSATISGTNITVTLPHSTSITSLTPSIAYSENATITPQGAQNFTSPVRYTVSAEDGTTKVYTVTVKVEAAPITPPKADTKVKVTKVSLATTPPVYLVKGKTLTLKASVQPYNATNKKLTFKSLSPKIVKVDKNTGKMKALKTGKARIVVTSVDGKKKAACTIIVVAKTLKVKALKSFSPLTLTVGKTKQIKAKVTPAKATGVMPAYSSSNKKVATIDKAGVITAHKKGTATITVKAGGKTKTFKVIVR